MKVCEHTLNKAKTRLHDAVTVRQEATKAVDAAKAEFARLLILDYAASHPLFDGFQWRTDWEYNDEGYDETVYFVTWPEDLNEDYSFSDLLSGFGRSSLCVLCAGKSYDESGSVTLDELKKARF